LKSGLTERIALYHYTHTAGLLGIAEFPEMWATHVRHLNDTAEYFEALDRIKDALEERLKGVTFSSTAWTPHHALMAMREQDVFVICFSEDGNLLSQWRAYCPRDGYVIGFEPDDLGPLWLGGETTFSKCIYDRNDQEELLQAIAGSLIEEFSDLDVRSMEWISKAAGPAMLRAVHHAALIKNGHFHEEREWRFIASEPLMNDVRYRQGRLGLTPYLTFPLTSRIRPGDSSRKKKLVCATLTVGPRADERASMIAALSFARAKVYDVESLKVISCNIPFRE
jgi:hypothetical protein